MNQLGIEFGHGTHTKNCGWNTHRLVKPQDLAHQDLEISSNEYFDRFTEGYLSTSTLHFLPIDVLLLFPEFQLSFLHPSVYLSWMDFLRDCQCDGKVLCAVRAFVCLTNMTCSCHTHPVSKTAKHFSMNKSLYTQKACTIIFLLPAVLIVTSVGLNFSHLTLLLTVKYSL